LSEHEGRISVASYVMALEGDRRCFFYGTNYKTARQQNAWYPFYDVELGTPQGECEPRDAVYWRPLSAGRAVVNPTGSPATVELLRGHLTVSADEVDELTLGPKQAALLKLSGR